jgi:hypothetical protein
MHAECAQNACARTQFASAEFRGVSDITASVSVGRRSRLKIKCAEPSEGIPATATSE